MSQHYREPGGLSRSCMFIVAGKDATADGSVLMTYNNDWHGNNALRVEVVSGEQQAEPASGKEAWEPGDCRYVGFRNHHVGKDTAKGTSEGGMNEYQVGLVFGTEVHFREEVKAADPPAPDGFGTEGYDLVLQKSKTAREAMDLWASMVERQGIGEGAMGSLAIGDPTEVWFMEMCGGRHWVAQRVPDDCYVAEANGLQLRQIDLTDTDNFRGSPDIIEFAMELGLYDPKRDGDFDFAKAYSNMEVMKPYNRRRIWRAQSRFSPARVTEPDAPYEEWSVFVPPGEKIRARDFMAIMRDHYEGTQYDVTKGYSMGNPHFTPERPICIAATNYSAVWQLRDWMPREMGGVLWAAMASPCSSVYLPCYAGISETPQVYQQGNGYYDSDSAFWVYRGVANLVSGHYGHLIEDVREAWSAFEDEGFSMQEGLERAAISVYRDDPGPARDLLNRFSYGQAVRAYDKGKQLMHHLHGRISCLRPEWRW